MSYATAKFFIFSEEFLEQLNKYEKDIKTNIKFYKELLWRIECAINEKRITYKNSVLGTSVLAQALASIFAQTHILKKNKTTRELSIVLKNSKPEVHNRDKNKTKL